MVVADEFFSHIRPHRPPTSWHHVHCPDLMIKWEIQFRALVMNAEYGYVCAGWTFETMRQGILPFVREDRERPQGPVLPAGVIPLLLLTLSLSAM